MIAEGVNIKFFYGMVVYVINVKRLGCCAIKRIYPYTVVVERWWRICCMAPPMEEMKRFIPTRSQTKPLIATAVCCLSRIHLLFGCE
jgi:hypothetical protein